MKVKRLTGDGIAASLNAGKPLNIHSSVLPGGQVWHACMQKRYARGAEQV